MPNGGVAFAILPAGGGGDGLDAVLAVLQRRNRDVEGVRRALAGARETERLRSRRHLPTSGHLQRQRAFGFPFTIVEDLDGHSGFRRERFALSLSNGDDHVRRRQRHGDRGDDRQHARVVAVREVGIDPCDRPPYLDRHSVHLVHRDHVERTVGRRPVPLRVIGDRVARLLDGCAGEMRARERGVLGNCHGELPGNRPIRRCRLAGWRLPSTLD